MDWTLAIAHGASTEAVERLADEVFARLAWEPKVKLLGTTLGSATHPSTGYPADVHLPWLIPGLRKIVDARNPMAHGLVSSASTARQLHVQGQYRGRGLDRVFSLSEVDYLRRGLPQALNQDLAALGSWTNAGRVPADVMAERYSAGASSYVEWMNWRRSTKRPGPPS